MVRDSVQLETAVNTITHEYLLEFTTEYGWMSFSKRPGKNTPQCYSKPLDSLKNWNNCFFWVDECVFPPDVEWQTNASKDGMPASGTYSVEAAEAKFAAALQSLKDLKLPLLDQLEGLKDTPIDVIMASLYLEDDTQDDAPQFIRDLRPSSSQLAIPVYPEVRDPRNPWACTEEIKLADAIAANISRAKQKKRSRIVCQTHGVGSAHHARSDRVLVSAPIVVSQGLALILVDVATQTDPDV
nr:hypothetical protein [Tanacetum cinerariifolium]